MTVRRDHRLRDRRLALGLTQGEVGLHAYLPSCSCQVLVSNAERGKAAPHVIQKIRAVLVWLESAPRRERETARRVAVLVMAVNQPAPVGFTSGTAILCLSEWPVVAADAPAAASALVRRMADLLHEGETEAFDAIVAQIPDSIALRAGDLYLDECGTCVPSATMAT